MKLFDVDWNAVLSDLHRWSALSLGARRTLLDELKPNGYVPAARFGAHLKEIAPSGFAKVEMDRSRVSLAEEQRGLVKVLRAMGRHPVFDTPTPEALVKYLEEHFTQFEIEVLGAEDAKGVYLQVNRYWLAQRVGFSGWPGDLITADSDEGLVAWARSHGLRVDGRTPVALRNLQRLAQQLLASPSGMPLADVVSKWGAKDRHSLADAVHMGLGSLVLFGGMRGHDLEPMIGVWPAVAIELTRPRTQRPTTVVPVEVFELPVRMEDMTAVLATIAATPVRVRSDNTSVFARTRTDIEKRLAVVPLWAAQFYTPIEPTRVDMAASELERCAYVQFSPRQGNPHLEVTPAGRRWLALSPHDRLASILDPIRESKDANPPGSYETVKGGRFFPFALAYLQAPKGLHLRQALTQAFLGASDGFLPLEPFLDFAMREANPLLDLHKSDRLGLQRAMHFGASDPRESYRALWRNMLVQFLITQLLGLGGARIGRLGTGAICFSITDIGRYLFGAGQTFTYGSVGTADIVIQPNFDVVFLGAAPSIEAELARFAERTGVAPGLAFRITRASVLGAAEAGATAAGVIGALARASSKPVPANVQREITGWMASVRRARLRTVEVLECADEESAHRVAAILGAKVRRLTTTMFELPAATPAARSAALKRLRSGGVFLDQPTEPEASRPRVKRPRRSPSGAPTQEVWDDDVEWDEVE